MGRGGRKVEGAFVLGGPGGVAEGIPGCRGGDFRAAPAPGGGSDPDAVLLILLSGSSPLVVSGFSVQPPSFETAVAYKVKNVAISFKNVKCFSSFSKNCCKI